MQIKFLLLLCTVAFAVAYPHEPAAEQADAFREDHHTVAVGEPVLQQSLKRVRRQKLTLPPAPQQPAPKPMFQLPPPQPGPKIELQGGGGGSRRNGFDVSVDARAPVWQSGNQRHRVDATGGYSQHLGGQWGSSRPDYRGGATYTYSFGK